MTNPSARSYLASLRRFWYLPFVGLAMAFALSTLWHRPPAAVTTGDVIFAISAHDPGTESDGTARVAEQSAGQERLSAYASSVRRGAAVNTILSEVGVETFVENETLVFSQTPTSGRVMITADRAGIVTVRLENRELADDAGREIVSAIQAVVARDSLALDARQDTPAISAPPVIADPQTLSPVASQGTGVSGMLLPAFVGIVLGLGLIYILDWRIRKVEERADLETRLGVSIVGEICGRPGDSMAVALALASAVSGELPRVLLASAPGRLDLSSVGSAICDAAIAARASAALQTAGATPMSSADPGHAISTEPAVELVNLTSPPGLNEHLILEAARADLVVILVPYGVASMRELESMLIRLSDIPTKQLRAVGVRP